MTNNNKIIRIFMSPQEFPCGPQSSCCGSIGQTEEEIQNLKNAIEKELGCPVEVLNTKDGADMRKHLQIVRLIRSFGPNALPVVTLDDDVVSMGNSRPDEAVLAIKDKMQ